MTPWQPLRDELAKWRVRGIQPRFWLRDDDAIEPSDNLDHLLDVTRRHDVPLILAIIPARTGAPLAARLESERHARPAVHGWSHANHAAVREKQRELGPDRALPLVLEDCARGLTSLRALYGERLLAMLVPPWNRIDPRVATELPSIGFDALSAFGRETMVVSGLTIRNAHVDLIDWRGTRACHEAALLIERITAHLRMAREAGDPWCGILSHHLVGDPRQFGFLDRLFGETLGLWRHPV